MPKPLGRGHHTPFQHIPVVAFVNPELSYHVNGLTTVQPNRQLPVHRIIKSSYFGTILCVNLVIRFVHNINKKDMALHE